MIGLGLVHFIVHCTNDEYNRTKSRSKKKKIDAKTKLSHGQNIQTPSSCVIVYLHHIIFDLLRLRLLQISIEFCANGDGQSEYLTVLHELKQIHIKSSYNIDAMLCLIVRHESM